MRNRAGEVIRDYHLEEYAGEGAFAYVYRASHKLLEQTRAIKIIHPGSLTDHDQMLRFKSEAQVVASLHHPHILTLYEFWLDGYGAYIVMQWMAKGTLEEKLLKQGALEPREVLRIISQIAPALNLVHNHEIVHRDLKPANILFDAADDAHLADFGLAKWLVKPTSNKSMAGIVGTPAYMPPEQADPSSGFLTTAKSDIYSLGIILFEMLTGRHPFGATGLVEMLLHQLRDDLPSITDFKADLPDELDAIIQKATAKSPDDRFSDALALTEALRNVIDPKPVQNFLSPTATLTQSVKAAGDLSARIYTKSGAVLENPRYLIGREKLISRVSELLEANTHILLHGMAGIGKTAIAGTIAAKFLDVHADKQIIWIELGRQDADAFFEAVAQASGKFQAIAVTSGDERITTMRNILLETDSLLVIDNIWNESAILPIIRAIPHTMPLLMTSRIAMSVDGMMLDISALSEEDAMALLGYHTGKNYLDDDRAHELCKILGNHPYALEMAGKRLNVYGHLSPERLIRDIHNAPHNLVVTGKLGIEKQRSVKELLDESVDELSPDLHELLTQMGGLYASYASLNLLEKVTGKESDTLEYEIAELERNGLLQLHVGGDDVPAHYRLHDLTYSYVHTLSKKEKSHNNRVISGVQSFTREYVKDYDLLQFDLMNILGTARKAYHEKQHDNLISIMRQLVVDANYLTARGSPVAAMDLLKVTIEAARAMNDVEAAHYLLCKIGNVYLLVTNQYSHAVKAYSEAYEFSLQLQDLRR